MTVPAGTHPWSLIIDILSILLFFPVYGREFHYTKHECNECCLIVVRPIFLTGPLRCQFVPDTALIVPHQIVFSPRVVARVFFSYSTALGLPSQTHPMARRSLRAERVNPSLPTFDRHFCKLSCNIQTTPHLFLKRNRRFIAIVDHPLIPTRVFWVQDQFKLSKQMTL